MGTKIKSHRIENNAIEKRHIKNDVKFTENEDLTLNFPTHDNSNDLSLEQNQILTQGGNADTLHYHSGGGGGAAGILTNPEVDKAIMDLMLRVNAVETGMDNVILDQLDDIRDLDHGYNSPIISFVQLEDGTSLENSLLEGDRLGYRLLTKIDGGHTNTSSDYFINITPGYTFPTALLFLTLPPENEGYQLYRRKVSSMEYNAKFNDITNISSKEEIDFEIVPSDYFSQNDFLRIDARENNIRSINSHNNIFENQSNVYMNFGEFIVPENYTGDNTIIALKTNSTINKINKILIDFNDNELDIARDFIIEFATVSNPNIYDDSVWNQLTNIRKTNFMEDNFEIENNIIINNNEFDVEIAFDDIRDITAIRFTVLDKVEAVYVMRIYAENLLATDTYEIGHINKKLINKFDSKDIKNFEYKIRNSNNEIPDITAKFKNELGWYYPNIRTQMNIENNISHYTIENKIVRTTTDGVYEYSGITKDDMFNIKLRNHNPGAPITIRNMNIVACQTYNQKDIINRHYETLTEITFNNGENEITTDEEYFYTDLFKFINFPKAAFTSGRFPIITFEVVGVADFWMHSDSYNYTWIADPLTTEVDDPGNGGNFSVLNSSYTPCVISRYKTQKEISLEKTVYEENKTDFRKDVNYNVFSHPYTNFNINEIEFHVTNSRVDSLLDIADIKFHNKKEIFQSGYMKEYSTAGYEEYLINNNGNYYYSSRYPTPYNPVISTYLFLEPHLIDNLRLELYSSETLTPRDFKIQVTNSASATLGDPETSEIWNEIQNPYFMAKLLRNEIFTGQIDTENGITNNNLFNCEMDLGFDPVEVQGIRFIFYSAINPSAQVHIQSAFVYESIIGNDTYELIADVSTNQPESVLVLDDNLQSLDSLELTDLPKNETGSRNIWFDATKKLIEVIDKAEPGIVITKTIYTDGVLNFLMNIQKVIPDSNVDSIQTFISNNGGDTYALIEDFDFVNTLDTIGGNVKIKFILNNNAKLNAYSLLYSL